MPGCRRGILFQGADSVISASTRLASECICVRIPARPPPRTELRPDLGELFTSIGRLMRQHLDLGPAHHRNGEFKGFLLHVGQEASPSRFDALDRLDDVLRCSPFVSGPIVTDSIWDWRPEPHAPGLRGLDGEPPCNDSQGRSSKLPAGAFSAPHKRATS